MTKITNYLIARDPLAARLEMKVREYIEHGWEPSGSPFVAGPLVCQAMIYKVNINNDLQR